MMLMMLLVFHFFDAATRQQSKLGDQTKSHHTALYTTVGAECLKRHASTPALPCTIAFDATAAHMVFFAFPFVVYDRLHMGFRLVLGWCRRRCSRVVVFLRLYIHRCSGKRAVLLVVSVQMVVSGLAMINPCLRVSSLSGGKHRPQTASGVAISND